MNPTNRHLAQYNFSNTDDDDIHGGDDYRVFDDQVDPECPATAGEHSLVEVTSTPLSPSGRCEVFLVCCECGAEVGPVGSDGVL